MNAVPTPPVLAGIVAVKLDQVVQATIGRRVVFPDPDGLEIHL